MAEQEKNELIPESTEPEQETAVTEEEASTEEVEEETVDETEEEEASLEPDTSELARQLQDLRTENAYLKGLAANQAKAAEPKREEDDDEVDDDAFMEQLKTNPAKALKDRDERIIKKFTKQLNSRDTMAAQAQAQAAQDAQTVLQFYPDIQKQPEFLNTATQLYNALRQQYGDAPGLRTLAAHTAYGVLVRDGKMPSANQTKKPLEKKARPPVGLEPKRATATSESDPLEGFSGPERESIMRTCRKFGIDPAEYRKQFEAAKKDDKTYGI